MAPHHAGEEEGAEGNFGHRVEPGRAAEQGDSQNDAAPVESQSICILHQREAAGAEVGGEGALGEQNAGIGGDALLAEGVGKIQAQEEAMDALGGKILGADTRRALKLRRALDGAQMHLPVVVGNCGLHQMTDAGGDDDDPNDPWTVGKPSHMLVGTQGDGHIYG